MQIQDLIRGHPIIGDLADERETLWVNPDTASVAAHLEQLSFGREELEDARLRLERFRPFIVRAFPETAARGGLIESDLVPGDAFKESLCSYYHEDVPGRFLIKKDSHLPISGSIKARGGIYEVLKTAETLAFSHNILSCDTDYSFLATPRAVQFFSRFSLAVGSTGNLGLSIGVMGATLGFQVVVHMSSDARQWKKDLLRQHGVQVVEHDSDYGRAVAEGRAQALDDPFCHFVDDEHSLDLFLGYAVAGERLKAQLEEHGVTVDREHPLFCHLPCGVGGGPGGLAFGLKCALGDHVHCVFAEPTQAPAMLLGLATGLHDEISVRDIGLSLRTAADGLAVGRASSFVGRAMGPWIDAVHTVSDDNLFRMLALADMSQELKLEPSAVAGCAGPLRLAASTDYKERHGLAETMHNATHILWATGGGMVPEEELAGYLDRGQELLAGR